MSRVISTHHQTAQRRYIPCSNWRESKVSFLHCTITSWFAIAKDSYHPSQSVHLLDNSLVLYCSLAALSTGIFLMGVKTMSNRENGACVVDWFFHYYAASSETMWYVLHGLNKIVRNYFITAKSFHAIGWKINTIQWYHWNNVCSIFILLILLQMVQRAPIVLTTIFANKIYWG